MQVPQPLDYAWKMNSYVLWSCAVACLTVAVVRSRRILKSLFSGVPSRGLKWENKTYKLKTSIARTSTGLLSARKILMFNKMFFKMLRLFTFMDAIWKPRFAGSELEK